MARFRNKKNGRTAVVVEEDRKYKTVLIQYEDDESEQQVSSATLKRWWEEIDEDEEEVDDEDYEDIDDEEEEYEEEDDEEEVEDDFDEDGDDEEEEVDDDEEKAGDGTPLKEVGKEIAHQAIQKAKGVKKPTEKPVSKQRRATTSTKTKTAKVDTTPYKEDIVSMSEEIGFEPVQYEKLPGLIVLKAAGHGKVDVRIGRSKFSVNVKEHIAEESGLEYRTVNNYYLPAVIDFQYNAYKKDLKSLLKSVYKDAMTKKTKKEEK